LHGGAFLVSAILLAPPATQLFSSDGPVELTLEAPLQRLFDKGVADESFSVKGALSYRDASSGTSVAVRDVELSVRGHTSKQESECSFPKLKIEFKDGSQRDRSIFAGMDALRLGTHCGESQGEERTPKYGRLANEKSPHREAFVYRLLDAAGVATLKARPARVTYIDKDANGSPLVRNAVLVEDDDAVIHRLEGTTEITREQFSTARDQFNSQDTARLAFAQAMIANFDWCLRFYPEDTYRCDDTQRLWNVLAVARRDGRAIPVIGDFDLAGIVVGRHRWFEKVYGDQFVASRSTVETEVLSQVQRTRSLFTRAELDEARRHFMARKGALYDTLETAHLDPRGRELAKQHLDAFYDAIASDDAFYRPVVVKPYSLVYADAAKSREACSPGDMLPTGTPVNERRREGTMAEVVLLDARWRWAPPADCQAVKSGTVWIDAAAISREYPPR
jgi:hypothetical protein